MKAPISLRAVTGFLGLLLVVTLFAGCHPEELPPDRTAMLPDDQRVSSMPWNKQQGWENNSQLGALANDPRIGGGQSGH